MIQYQELPEVKSDPAENLVAQFRDYIQKNYFDVYKSKSNVGAFFYNFKPFCQKAIGKDGKNRMVEFLDDIQCSASPLKNKAVTNATAAKFSENADDSTQRYLDVLCKIFTFAAERFEKDRHESKSGKVIKEFIYSHFNQSYGQEFIKIIDNYSETTMKGKPFSHGLRKVAQLLQEMKTTDLNTPKKDSELGNQTLEAKHSQDAKEIGDVGQSSSKTLIEQFNSMYLVQSETYAKETRAEVKRLNAIDAQYSIGVM